MDMITSLDFSSLPVCCAMLQSAARSIDQRPRLQYHLDATWHSTAAHTPAVESALASTAPYSPLSASWDRSAAIGAPRSLPSISISTAYYYHREFALLSSSLLHAPPNGASVAAYDFCQLPFPPVRDQHLLAHRALQEDLALCLQRCSQAAQLGRNAYVRQRPYLGSERRTMTGDSGRPGSRRSTANPSPDNTSLVR